MPYTIVIYPLVFLVLVRLWSVSHRHGFVTPADFVRNRFDSPMLALLVAITGIVATMPYIALQLVGIEAVLKTMGVTGESALARHLPIIIAFAILAAYTYQSGLRAPALIAFVKDTLIYIVILVAIIYLPYKLGGWGEHLRRGGREVRRLTRTRTTASCSTPTTSSSTSRWRSARRWRSSSTRTASPACWPAGTGT